VQLRNTVVAVVEVLSCAPQNNLNHLLKIWFATLRRRVFSQAFRNQFPPVKELSVINARKHFNEVTVPVSKPCCTLESPGDL
jgi:hypothetical protein